MRFVFAASLAALFALSASAASVPSAPVELKPGDLPRLAPTEATNALKAFKIKPGFKLQLVASEPLIYSPIALSFDEEGRMFVVEMRDYSELHDLTPHLGRIRMLEDTNHDGIYDKATVYADDLPWPTAVFCYGGGVFVGATPDVLYFKDTNGDGKADVRKKIFTGFGVGKDRLNVQALFNSFNWGLDNKIHGQTAGNGGMVVSANNTNGTPIDVRGRDFWFDPRTLEFGTEAGGGQYGMSYDNHGRKFVCSNSDHIQTFMYDSHYADRNPFYNMPPAKVSIAVDGPAAEVFRISPEEAWRVIRTKWRVTGVVPGIIEGGGRSSGYFTGATGLTIYRGNALGEDFVDDAFIGDAGSNLVHRKKVHHNGLELSAERPADEQKVEFLASPDNWFRPVDMFNAPDGALYVIDMYREVIEHPWSLPDSIKKYIDLNSGSDRGRIYRVVPENFKQPKPVHLGKATTKELVATLENSNGWTRDTAARLIYERQDKAAVPLLEKLWATSKSPLTRMHALHVLDGLNALTANHLIASMGDKNANVREHAIKLAEKLMNVRESALLQMLYQKSFDSDIRVRFQLAFTLGEFFRLGKPRGAFAIEALTAIAKKDYEDSWMQVAILSSLSEGAGEMFGKLSGDAKLAGSKKGQEFLRQLVVLVGGKNKKEEVAQVLDFISKGNNPAPLTFAMTRALGEGLQRNNGSLPNTDSVKAIFSSATKLAADETADEPTRIAAVRLLGLSSYGDAGKTLLELLNLKQPQAVQLAAIGALSRFSDPQVGKELIERWNSLTPRLRSEAVSVLLARPERATALLKAIEAGEIRVSVLNSTQTKFLRNHQDKEVHQLAVKVLAAKPASTRQQVIDSFMPALNLKGDAAHGKKIYEQLCISCHRLGGEGFALGPDLVTVKTSGKEKILVNILDPNREVRPEFVSYVVETKSDDTLIGLVANETATSVTLRQAFGKEDVIPRSNIVKMQSQGLSLMPEGLESGLTAQDFADLLGYIEAADSK